MEENYEIIDNDLYSEINEDNLIYIENQNTSIKGKPSSDNSVRGLKEKKISNIISSSSNNKMKSMINTSLNLNKSNILGITSLNSSLKKITNNNEQLRTQKTVFNPSLQFGERLYRKSVALKEVKEKKSQNLKISQEIEVSRHCSFKPKLNDESCFLTMRRLYTSSCVKLGKNYDLGSLVSSPINSVRTKNKKVIESHLKKKEDDDMSEVRPSKKVTQKEVDKITTKLFNEAEALKAEREKEKNSHFNEVYTFTPKIIDSSKPKLENFYKRLQSWVEKRNEKFSIEMEQASKDSKTGQKLFSPQITKRNNFDSNISTTRNVFIDLYEENKKLNQNKKESWVKNEEEINILANSKKATSKIEEIDSTNKYECFLKLFEILDKNNDNQISYTEEFLLILNDNLNPEIRTILEPLITEFSLHNETLNREEFVIALDQLYGVLNVDQKRKLVNWYVMEIKRSNSPRRKRTFAQSVSSTFPFKPQVSEASSKVFESSQRYAKGMLERNKDHIKKKESYCQAKLEEKQTSEIKGCTFRPSIVMSPNKV